ncbi:uncharacterized protein LOC129302714 [Prosopis cineraria]|uniref:uncharacterized protein LOC129302714 n=1 Tax=Prosopis cineraria TaxID=364024 RepID=UPI00240FEBFC|nr:uncharacterized protein LOC129302714 [Prosopis cineraria]
MGMDYRRIHACLNDCILYKNEYEGLHKCPKCGTLQYKVKKTDDIDHGDEIITKGLPAKVMWYLPIIPQFQRLFANPIEAKNLRWHFDEKLSDRKLRHLADSPQWKTIDHIFPQFGSDSRNLRLGLCTDGINPYGPKQPGNNIDIFLAPLIEDLKMLWEEGVDVFDAYKQEHFKLRVMIFTIINEFPAYENLSGYSVKGHNACPICEEDTHYHQLKHGRKIAYLGHRRFLDRYHPYCRLKKAFNGSQEYEMAPKALTGDQVYQRVEGINVIFDVRHSLDMMHAKKNVCDSLIGMLLHISGKTKDGINARLDLAEMGIRKRLHAQQKEGKKAYLPPTAHILSKEEKRSLCRCLHAIKVPQGYSSNVRKLVSISDLKLLGMKSHDCHVLMQQLLLVAIRGIMKDDVRHTITRLCMFFNAICSKVIDPDKLDELENEGYITLCQLEMHFAPVFFDIMVHLILHLVREVRLCSPVYLRWMYPFERYMKILKRYSKNPYRPQASIVERSVAEEAVEFCTTYLKGLKAVGVSQTQHEGIRLAGKGTRGVRVKCMSHEEVLQAHLYILNNMKEVQPYLDAHKKLLKDKYPRKNEMQLANEHNKTFKKWFKEKVTNETSMSDTIMWLAEGPHFEIVCWDGYDINGYSFYTKAQDDKSTMQNSRVMVKAKTQHFSSLKDNNPLLARTDYYGVVDEIWEVNYTKFKIPIFKCRWVHFNAIEVDKEFGFISVDLKRLSFKEEPFILASQEKQVFYVIDPANKQRSIVLLGKKQIIDVEDDDSTFNLDETLPFTINLPRSTEVDLVDDEYAIRDDHCEGIWENE